MDPLIIAIINFFVAENLDYPLSYRHVDEIYAFFYANYYANAPRSV